MKIKYILYIVICIIISLNIFAICDEYQLVNISCDDYVKLQENCSWIDVHTPDLSFYYQNNMTYSYGEYYYNFSLLFAQSGTFLLDFCDNETWAQIEVTKQTTFNNTILLLKDIKEVNNSINIMQVDVTNIQSNTEDIIDDIGDMQVDVTDIKNTVNDINDTLSNLNINLSGLNFSMDFNSYFANSSAIIYQNIWNYTHRNLTQCDCCYSNVTPPIPPVNATGIRVTILKPYGTVWSDHDINIHFTDTLGGNLSYCNATMLNSDLSFNTTLNDSFNLTTTYDWSLFVYGNYVINVECFDNNSMSNYSRNSINIFCNENWKLQYSSCIVENDTRLKYYTDSTGCGKSYSLPADNGTYVQCSTNGQKGVDMLMIIFGVVGLLVAIGVILFIVFKNEEKINWFNLMMVVMAIAVGTAIMIVLFVFARPLLGI